MIAGLQRANRSWSILAKTRLLDIAVAPVIGLSLETQGGGTAQTYPARSLKLRKIIRHAQAAQFVVRIRRRYAEST
jgi:hypothetical protein